MTWKPGDEIASPVDSMVSVDPASAEGSASIYKLMIGAIVPRPIAFISTVSPGGVGNLAPFSYFNGVSSDPPCLMVAITRKSDGDKKDTLKNIEATRQFVVNTVAEWIAEPMNQCSAEYPYGVDEMRKVGLTGIASVKVRPPRVKESPIQMECELYDTLRVGDGRIGSAVIVVGRIVLMHVHAAAFRDGKILLDQIKPLARLAGFGYAKVPVANTFDLPRPKA